MGCGVGDPPNAKTIKKKKKKKNTQREERLREKRKMFLIKSDEDLPQGELLRREERLRKTFFVQKTQKSFS